jgi:AbrB family looped-hinge helix DNA binding protein
MAQYHYTMVSMTTTVTIDKAGRVVIPKSVRDDLRLEPGDSLALDFEGDSVVLRPASARPTMLKEHGIWVVQGGPRSLEEANQMIDEDREERDRHNLGV